MSYLAFSNFALAPFICLQLSILLPSCRRAAVAMAPGTVDTKLVQVAFAAAVAIIAQTGSRFYVYRDRDGHLHELRFEGSWSHRNLSAAVER